jgi:hypothetical protein
MINKLNRLEKNILHIKLMISRILGLRWIIFFLSIFSLIFFWENYHHYLFYSLMAALLVVFIITSIMHSFFERKLTKWKLYYEIVTIQKNRNELNWKRLPEYRSPELSDEFDLITATDLNLIGPHSALHLIDSSISDFGQQTLVSNLLRQSEPLSKIRSRQKKIQELIPLKIFRMKFKLMGKLHSKELIKRDVLFSMFGSKLLNLKFFLVFTVLATLHVVNMILLVASILGEFKPYFLITALLIFAFYQLLKALSRNAFEVGLELQIALEHLLPVYRMMEELPIKKSDVLYEEFRAFKETPPSRLLKRINIVVACLSARANPLLGILLNFILPWDFGLLVILESLKLKHYSHLKQWMNGLGQLEALVSLADYSENSGGVFPIFIDSKNDHYFEGIDVAHPLLTTDKRAGNSYIIKKDAPLAVLTGSNMAGKSTFLRTIGINIALAKAGAKVPAQKFALQNLTIMSLIKAQDFLEKEMSLFYFEVKRLKEILVKGRESSSEFPFLFLVDEIYRGTNNQERYQGAVAYLREFITISHCCGILTTHDMNVAETMVQNPSIGQYHFREVFKDGALFYDYKINDGICQTTNALRIMQQEGLPI